MFAIRCPRRFPVFILLAILTGSLAAETQSPRRNIQFQNLTTANGLSSEFVHSVTQGSQGFMWFASQSGLNRYDGYDVEVYEHLGGDLSSLSHNFIWSLFVDRDGILWVGTDRGINRYRPDTDDFEREPFGPEIARARIRAISQDRTGNYWIGTLGDGLFRIDANGAVRRYAAGPNADQLPHDRIITLLATQDGKLWVGTDGGGLARYDPERDAFDRYQAGTDAGSLSDNQIRALYEDSEETLWIGTGRGGLNRLRAGNNEFERFEHRDDEPNSIGKGQVLAIKQDAAGSLWVGTEGGLSEWREATGTFEHYIAGDRGDGLANNRVNAIFQDASGVLWLGTHGGVSSWNYLSEAFRYYDAEQGYLQSNVVTAVAESDAGVLWVSTYGGGLTRLDLMTGDARHYRHDPADSTSLPDDRVMAVHVDSDGRVWAGTRAGGLALLDADGGGFKRFRHDASNDGSISGNAITRILSGPDKSIWVGVFDGGLNRLKPGADRFEHFRHEADRFDSLSSDRVLALFFDGAGRLWVGTEGAGLNLFIPESNNFRRIDIENLTLSDGTNPINGTPWTFHESEDNHLWIGTLGHGLLEWVDADRHSERPDLVQFSSPHGLSSEIYGVESGESQALWLSSSRGLFRFDRVSASGRKFDRKNGLKSNEFNHGATLRSQSGELVFGGTSGVLVFDPAQLPHNDQPPRIFLKAESRTGELARVSSKGDRSPTVRLGYLDTFLSFDFVALDFISPDKNSYRFRMHGLDDDWTEVTDYRRAIYTSLPGGNYTFEVMAANNDGIWNKAGPTIDVVVEPPPWNTTWAYLLYLIAAGSVIALYLNRQHSKRKQEASMRLQLQGLVEERTAELKQTNEELRHLNQQLADASVTDSLTGLHNRRYVDQFIETEVSLIERAVFAADKPENVPMLFMMMIDLDGFKQINDSFGHHAGDAALLEASRRLQSLVRKSDIVVRWGGDEFMVIGHAQNLDGANIFAEKVRQTLAAPDYDVGNGNVGKLTGSIGVATLPFADGDSVIGSWEQVVSIADQAALLAKANGRNAWVSVHGTETFTDADLTRVRDELGKLVSEQRVKIETSLDALDLELNVVSLRG